MNKTYIGDSVYVEFDGYNIWLMTNNGYEDENKICLEPPVLESLLNYVNKCGFQVVNNANE